MAVIIILSIEDAKRLSQYSKTNEYFHYKYSTFIYIQSYKLHLIVGYQLTLFFLCGKLVVIILILLTMIVIVRFTKYDYLPQYISNYNQKNRIQKQILFLPSKKCTACIQLNDDQLCLMRGA
ncbi:hypothetical protein RF11_16220 [Thelohanellus kitauei]|uniref:Transmembrane protein n=1 Tax=Thelohanellus kitauei TaxID=669202 RepID=A0A0C2MKL3_THEKT|nr:hypothetical protein RF11_16220 [Thelohanellus kitauei]